MDDAWTKRLDELYMEDEFDAEFDLMHYGVAHDENPPGPGSGRYPFGSGDRMLQRDWDIYSRYRKLKASGMSETDIARALDFWQTDKDGNYKLDKNGERMPSTSKLRANATIAKNNVRQNGYVKECKRLAKEIDPDTGKLYTNTKIGQILEIGESSVRNYIKSDSASYNASKPTKVADTLRDMVEKKDYIDVGRGVELSLGVSPEGLKTSLEMLKKEGYQVAPIYLDQVGGERGNKTTINVLYKPGVEYKQMFKDRFKIQLVDDPEGEGTLTALGIQDPVRIKESRVQVRLAQDGGTNKDGTVEIRAYRDEQGRLMPACEDLSLGNAKYAQVRIAVEGDKYIKGMAFYNTDLPENVDVLVNSNKKTYEKAFKEMKPIKDKDGNVIGVDPDNPFGSTVYQSNYIDKNGEKKLSAINIVGDIYGVDQHKEGAWDEWSRNLPAQFLSKQSETLIKQQLKLKVQEKQQEYDEILQLNNPVVKKQMLKDFADGCDASAVDLKAAALPGQRVQVLLPLETIKDNEVYAPNYDNGQTLALIRYPHTGPFEIPIVKVNNNNKEAKKFLEDSRGQAKDAIGINYKTAQILSGADFDGDTVTAIPMTRKNSQGEFEKTVNIKGLGNGQSKLPDLDAFDPTEEWPGADDAGNPLPGVKLMDNRKKGMEMGVISNLITDMSLKGCESPEEMSRAVRYSMVVIDAYKHKLDYRAAEKAYNIKELKEKYQVNEDGTHGVSTLVSRAKSPVKDIPQRQNWTPNAGRIDPETGKLVGNTIDPETGEKIYRLAPHRFYKTRKEVKVIDPDTGKPIKIGEEEFKDKNGKTRKRSVYLMESVEEENERNTSSTRMAEAKNAYELLSDNPSNKEYLYADYANKMKSMANEARKEWLNVPKLKMNPAAKKEYSREVKSLEEKFIRAKKNAPRERQAQLVATQMINSKLEQNPDMDKDDKKRLRGQALNGARDKVGAKKDRIKFTEKEWEAINAGAISETRLTDLLKNADSDNYKALATPKSSRISASTAARIESLLNAGWSRKDIENAGYASMETIKSVENGTWQA